MTRKARIGLLLVLAMAVVLTVCVASALAVGVTLEVGAGHYATIQAAVDAASTGDTILVEAGIYAENVLISHKNNITIRGVGDTTLVEGDGIGFRIHTSSGITIEDLKIHTVGDGNHGINVDGEALDGGVSNNLTVRNTTIVTEGTGDFAPTGIIGDSVAAGVHSGWLITGNTITGAGGGIGLQDVTNSTISNNTITIDDGTNIYWTSERYNLTDLVIEHNTVSGSGGSQVSVMTDWNEISGGTAVPLESPVVQTTITGVTFHGNTFADWGSRAIRVGDGSGGSATGTVADIVINGNTFQMTEDLEVIGGTDAPPSVFLAGSINNTYNVTAPATIAEAEAAALIAQGTINVGPYTLTYSAGANGTISGTSPQTVNSGGSGTAVTAVASTGYHFTSWSDGGLTAARTDTNVTANKSVTANFAINSCTISFDSNGGSAVTAITQDCGTAVTAPTPPTKTGNTFAGWYSDVALATPYTFGTMPASSITLYAKWTVTPVLMPVWRFYNMRTGAHFYTADPAEMANVRDTLYRTYRLEGVAYYVNTANPANNTPLYRFFNVKTGVHFYTADPTEMANVRDTLYRTYRLEGVGFYLAP